eukprot:CAMPEP_0202899128 /NCGR_PEP_ID=MMETSP1392-20130828/7450_1 /ASSEMBLY_ACC=CAM_ASM_000868 /TAXON_ID=225041 /ORGANISM="Chlamydomonas chlamydogama, Strain SAG 11-48b" /LENGTH=97 /DNA_ID=CAMNT_0049585235 /DNA_START=124 /DNA_END=417 /DNA_ORIENTATION=-
MQPLQSTSKEASLPPPSNPNRSGRKAPPTTALMPVQRQHHTMVVNTPKGDGLARRLSAGLARPLPAVLLCSPPRAARSAKLGAMGASSHQLRFGLMR